MTLLNIISKGHSSLYDGIRSSSGKLASRAADVFKRAKNHINGEETREPNDRSLKVIVAGGGPVGLLAAIELKYALGEQAVVRVFENRWMVRDGLTVWRGEDEGNRRREQVVTLQSRVFTKLSSQVVAALFPEGGFAEVWPHGADSPVGIGRPRNIRIRDVEDRLLDLARSLHIELVCRRFNPAEETLSGTDVLAVCDGAGSSTREYFRDDFGRGDASPYSLGGQHVVDFVLGLRVKSSISPAAGVTLTIAQNRFLLNPLNGAGFLNMRLTAQEASEVRGVSPQRRTYTDCIQSSPCTMVRDGNNNFVCPTHGTLFGPALDPTSFLWPRILEGLKAFSVKPEDLISITSFRLSMEQRGRFTAQVFSAGSKPVFAALLGDAANAIHFWPGRGLNHGILSAVSFARTLARWNGRAVRFADFTQHEALMAALQQRHKTRAWMQMVTRRGSIVKSIADVIGDAMLAQHSRAKLLAEMTERIDSIKARLRGRLGVEPDSRELANLLASVDDETLQVMVMGGAWEMDQSGGEEVDVDVYNPTRSNT